MCRSRLKLRRGLMRGRRGCAALNPNVMQTASARADKGSNMLPAMFLLCALAALAGKVIVLVAANELVGMLIRYSPKEWELMGKPNPFLNGPATWALLSWVRQRENYDWMAPQVVQAGDRLNTVIRASTVTLATALAAGVTVVAASGASR